MINKTIYPDQWQAPSVSMHTMGSLNKFGHKAVHKSAYTDSLEGVPVNLLIQKYGSPLFVTSESKIRANVRRLKNAFKNRYPHVVHGWSYKTNYNGAVCNIFHQEDSWAEVVSRYEYDKARRLGVPGSRIIFNGPNKPDKTLEKAILEGARIHVDRQDELERIESIAKKLGRVCPVTLRLNFDTGYAEAWSRFGFNVESAEAMLAARYIQNSEHLFLNGLHSHIGTFILDTRAYAAQVQIMCNFLHQVEAETDARIEAIDIGGGFASKNSLQGVYLPPEQIVPTLDDYAEAICSTLMLNLQNRQRSGRRLPMLIIESGRAMIDDTQVLLTSVIGRKQTPDGRNAVIVDAGVNLLFTGFWYNHPVKLTRATEGEARETVLYGPLCMNIDVVRKSVLLPPLVLDDVLCIESVGAYNNTQWMQFIEYRPNVVMIHENNTNIGGMRSKNESEMATEPCVSVIRHAENLDSMMIQEEMPEHLRKPCPEESVKMPCEKENSLPEQRFLSHTAGASAHESARL